jgi:hypothetical protein
VACARCHDHKFDPIPQRDYYAIAGIFRSTQTQYGTIRVIQSYHETPLERLPAGCSIKSARPAMSREEWSELKRQRDELKASYESRSKAGLPTTGSEFNKLATMTARLDEYDEDGTPKLKAMTVRDREEVVDSPLFDRGEIDKPLAVVPRGFLQVLGAETIPLPERASGRRELADWIADRGNPLAARVMVNRVWSHLFGRGLVPTPDNFGTAGMPPDNQPLLDHLAIGFMEDGWSVKRLIRRIVQSRAYQLSSRHDSKNFAIDPENVTIWRMSPLRLDAEVLRDCLLSVAGRLESRPLVGSEVAQAGEDNSNSLLRRLAAIDAEHRHRAIYLPVVRDSVVESLALFDFADPSVVVGQRTITTVPSQSLFLLNSRFVEKQALAAAERMIEVPSVDGRRWRYAYLTLLGREPSVAEVEEGERFLAAYRGSLAGEKHAEERLERQAWGVVCQALMASSDFLYRR